MSHDDDLAPLSVTRQRRIRVVAWVAIVALILTGGGATVIALFLG